MVDIMSKRVFKMSTFTLHTGLFASEMFLGRITLRGLQLNPILPGVGAVFGDWLSLLNSFTYCIDSS